MPSKPKVFVPHDELVSDADGVCLLPYEKLGTYFSSGVHIFLGTVRRLGEGKGQGKNSTGRNALGQNYWVFLGFVSSCTTTKGVEAARALSLWAARPHQWLHLGREAYLKWEGGGEVKVGLWARGKVFVSNIEVCIVKRCL